MSKCWRRSGLTVGEKVIVPETFFIEKDYEKIKSHLVSTRFDGETDAGIFIKATFATTFSNDESVVCYRKMINWASIWCGDVVLYRKDGSRIVAVNDYLDAD